MNVESDRGDLRFGTIPGVLAQAVRAWPDRVALEDGPTLLTYSGLSAVVDRAAAALAARGVGPGDRVAIWAPNVWEWVPAALAVHAVGAAVVPINTRYKGPEARYIVEKSAAKLLFTVDGFLGLDFRAMLALPELPTVVFRGDGKDCWESFLEHGSAEWSAGRSDARPDAICDILFTSGTTGRPKGVLCTHSQTVRAYWTWSDVVGLQHTDRYLVVAPFFHAFGYKAGWLAALMRGATILPQATFDVDAVLERIPRDRVSMLPGPPALYQTLLLRRDLADHDLSSLRLAVTGAASIPVQLIHEMRDVLGFDTVITGYGLTESTGICTMCRHDDDPETIATRSGRAIPGVEVQTLDADGRPTAPDVPGHVVVRGYAVMQGYLDDPEATAETIRDGWLQTGDVGVLDDRGYIRITDRIKDMFIVGGFNAYPAEIEHTLLTHPDLADAAVIGVPDERLGEVGAAFLVPRAGRSMPDATSLRAWCRERMANFKVPRHFVERDALPRNASGKVTRFVLRQQWTDARVR
jgi:acyl-CoA synthetase (AMP-forming)/AMP-acid ligase II